MYAVAFDLDTNVLKEVYPGNSWNQAYYDIKSFLKTRGFGWQQGSVYYGDETVNAVRCVSAIQTMALTYPWFRSAVRDIRMLRIEDDDDLMPAIDEVLDFERKI